MVIAGPSIIGNYAPEYGLIEAPFLKSWMLRFALIFGLATAVEISQAFGIPLFGQTFDPLDIAMYALGTLLAALLDEVLLPRIFSSGNQIVSWLFCHHPQISYFYSSLVYKP